MRALFASAVLVSYASALDAMAVPDFVAGFVYGMTGDNHLTEIEACYDGSTEVVNDVQAAVAKIESGSYLVGFAEIGKIIHEFPATLTTCQSMDEDIAAIEQWATIFTEPKELAETLSKNWLLHRRTIKEDLSEESADWDAGNYFQAGVDTALAMTEAVGPIESTANGDLGFDLMMIPDLVAGFVFGITGDMQLEEIEACYASAAPLDQYIKAFIADIKQFHLLGAFVQLQKFIFNLQKDLAPCTAMGDDLKIIENWALIVEEPEQLGRTITYNYLMHKKEIQADLAKEESDWSNGAYFDAGKDLADLSVALIGPAPTEVVAEVPANIDVHMINYTLAGLIYGLTTENHLAEIEACYAGGAEIDHEIVTAIHEFKAGGWNNITQGVLEVLLAALQLPQELHTCKGMSADLKAIEEWASIFTNKTKLISTVSKHYLFHKQEVQDDITQLKSDYAAAEYFHGGEDIANLMTILIGPITA